MAQKKYSFDTETLKKIARGAIIAGTATAGLYILGAMETIDFGSTWTPLIAALIPFAVNALREWAKGEQ